MQTDIWDEEIDGVSLQQFLHKSKGEGKKLVTVVPEKYETLTHSMHLVRAVIIWENATLTGN